MIEAVLQRFKDFTHKNNEKFFEADRLILSRTVRVWDAGSSQQRGIETLNSIFADVAPYPNIKVRNLSDSGDIEYRNQEAYTHEIVGRGGASVRYSATKDMAAINVKSAAKPKVSELGDQLSVISLPKLKSTLKIEIDKKSKKTSLA